MRRYPLLVPAIAFGLGVCLGDLVPPVIAFTAGLTFAVISYFASRSKSYWVILFASMLFLGIAVSPRGAMERQDAFLQPGEDVVVVGRVLDEPFISYKGKQSKTKFTLQVNGPKVPQTIRVILINARGEILQGDKLAVIGNLRPFSQKQRYSLSRYSLLGIGRHSYLLVEESRQEMSFFQRIRKFLLKRFEDLLPDPEAGFLQTMILGDRFSVSRELSRQFSDLGIIHILSVSGFHMSVMGLFLYFLARMFLLGPKGSMAAAFTGLVVYYFLSGESAPSFRSLVMALAFFAGRYLGREGNALNALALAFITALSIKASWLFDLSFQLSFLVVLGLVIHFAILPKITWKKRRPRALTRFKHYAWEALKLSLTAYLFSYGLVAYTFGSLSPLTVLINALLSPLFSFLIILGFLLCPFSFAGDAVGGLVSLIVYIPTHLFLELVGLLSKIPYLSLRGFKLSFEGLILYYVVLGIVYGILIWQRPIKIWIFERRLERAFKNA